MQILNLQYIILEFNDLSLLSNAIDSIIVIVVICIDLFSDLDIEIYCIAIFWKLIAAFV